ncbi:MAG: beta-ketoacyl-[acyl-carrier-protein] synthase family protein [Pseudomonadota bacterium]
MTRRAVITGTGAICSLGSSSHAVWTAMKAGTCGIGPLAIDHQGDLKTAIAAQISDIPEIDIEKRHRATLSGFSKLAVIAAGEALKEAGLDGADAFDPTRTGAIIGTGVFGADAVDQAYRTVFVDGKKRTEIFAIPKVMPSSPSVHVSMVYGIKGPVYSPSSACASGNHALCAALDLIRTNRADVVVAGGTDTPLTFGIIKTWESMRILAKTGCRPFSADREGLVLGDGAACLVIESEDHAKARGATILAELAGAGMTADAADMVSPDVDGAANAMRACMADADLSPTDINAINAHGTATLGNDKTETEAIRSAFAAHADTLAVSGTKSMHGHCLGASAAIEAVACVKSLRDQTVPPTINLHEADPECDLDYVTQGAREQAVDAIISNAFAFGGANASVCFRRYP